jgi:carbon storage regulator
MLVLSRKIGEKILIADNITVEIRRVSGNRVTLAVDAPRDVRILRGELQAAATAVEPTAADQDEQPEAPAARIESVVLVHAPFGDMAAMPHVLS